MKSLKILGLIFVCLMLSNVTFAHNYKFYDLRGDKVELKKEKTNIVIGFSTCSCHQCYLDINNYLVENSLFNRDDIDIVVIVNIEFADNKNIQLKREFYDDVKLYFPNVEKVYFNTKRRNNFPILLSYKIDEHLLPNVFVMQNNKLKAFYNSSEQFISQFVPPLR